MADHWSPKPSDFSAVFRSQNLWHSTGTVPDALAPPTERALATILWRELLRPDLRRQQVILGPRRVGKTTVMYQTVRRLLDEKVDPHRIWWVRLDHPLLINTTLGSIVDAIVTASNASEDNPAYLFLDEVTYAESWDLWLKTFFDEQYPVRIVATSSAIAALRTQTESGVGRWDERYLAPYLFSEYLELEPTIPLATRSLPPIGETLRETLGTLQGRLTAAYAPPDGPRETDWLERHRRRYMALGGFPELLLAKRTEDEASDYLRSQNTLRSDAIEKAIYKDIPQTFEVRDRTGLERLLYILAGQIAGLFSANNVSKDAALSQPTVERYANYFERAFLLFLLNNYAPTEQGIQRRGRKLFFVDVAVRNAALLRGVRPFSDPSEMGHLNENLVASHLRTLGNQTSVRLFHWRDGKKEVDFVYDHPTEPVAIEVASSGRHHRQGLNALVEAFPRFDGATYLTSPGRGWRAAGAGQHGEIDLDELLIAIGLQSAAAQRQPFETASSETRQLPQ